MEFEDKITGRIEISLREIYTIASISKIISKFFYLLIINEYLKKIKIPI